MYLDDIYRKMVYTETTTFTPALIDECKDFIIIADGFSKAYAMTGWRLGYAIAPKQLISKMSLLLETIVSFVPPFVQKAAIAAIYESSDYMRMMISKYKSRRDTLVEELNKIDGIHCIVPEGAFYLFANLKETKRTSREFQDIALEECNVGLVSGDAFGAQGEGYVRLCYALDERLAIEGIRRLANYNWK